MATSRFSLPVVRGRGLPATLLPTPVSSVRASLRWPLASGWWPLGKVHRVNTGGQQRHADGRAFGLAPHSPDSFSVGVEKRRPLRDAEGGRVVPGVLVVEVGGVEEVEALQGALHRQAEAGRPAAVTRQPTLRAESRRGVKLPD